jgi:protein-disulfide isomerase
MADNEPTQERPKPISLRDAPPAEPAVDRNPQPVVLLVITAGVFLLVGLMLATFIIGDDDNAISEDELRDTVEEVVGTQIAGLLPTSTPVPPTPTPIAVADAVDDDAYRGPADAPVVIVEFSDFQCGFCGRFYEQTLPLILETYPQEVKFVYRDFPIFGEDSIRAAMAAECAEEQNSFWEMHNRLFAIHDAAERVELTEDTLVGFAGELDLDTVSFRECLVSGRYREEVERDGQAAQVWGFGGTPGYIINGKVYTIGAQPFDVFQGIIEAELAHAAS